jgi:hypothetical protein
VSKERGRKGPLTGFASECRALTDRDVALLICMSTDRSPEQASCLEGRLLERPEAAEVAVWPLLVPAAEVAVVEPPA